MATDPLEDWIEAKVDPQVRADLETIAKERKVDLDTIVREAMTAFIVAEQGAS